MLNLHEQIDAIYAKHCVYRENENKTPLKIQALMSDYVIHQCEFVKKDPVQLCDFYHFADILEFDAIKLIAKCKMGCVETLEQALEIVDKWVSVVLHQIQKGEKWLWPNEAFNHDKVSSYLPNLPWKEMNGLMMYAKMIQSIFDMMGVNVKSVFISKAPSLSVSWQIQKPNNKGFYLFLLISNTLTWFSCTCHLIFKSNKLIPYS